MRHPRTWPRLLACVSVCFARSLFAEEAKVDASTEALIDKLPQTSEVGYGYSNGFGGSQFLPAPASARVGAWVFGAQAPKNSPTLEGIVRKGSAAVPALLKHLDDARKTKISPLSAIQWTAPSDEYDFNRRVRKDPPKGVNLGMDVLLDSPREPGQAHSVTIGEPGHEQTITVKDPGRSHKITVGDLCFVALGQIVNREFNATRYQPSGGMIISSPTFSERLCAVVRADFGEFNEEKHQQLLIQDFLEPDSADRRIGAARRIAFYYPQLLEPLVLKQLEVSTYDLYASEDFVRKKLYEAKSADERRKLFDGYVHDHGSSAADGIQLQLLDDLSMQEADEKGLLKPPREQKYDARTPLIEFYGCSPEIKSTDHLYVNSWSDTEKADFIGALAKVKSARIEAAVHAIFTQISDDDYLAINCMNFLLDRGYGSEIRKYCKQRIPLSESYAKELREVLKALDSRERAKKR